jgi:hypothetical protein
LRIGTEWIFRSTHAGALQKVLNAQLRASQSMFVCARMASAVRLATLMARGPTELRPHAKRLRFACRSFIARLLFTRSWCNGFGELLCGQSLPAIQFQKPESVRGCLHQVQSRYDHHLLDVVHIEGRAMILRQIGFAGLKEFPDESVS